MVGCPTVAQTRNVSHDGPLRQQRRPPKALATTRSRKPKEAPHRTIRKLEAFDLPVSRSLRFCEPLTLADRPPSTFNRFEAQQHISPTQKISDMLQRRSS
jgi:hypothetical protein